MKQVCPADGFELIKVIKRFGSKLQCQKCGLRMESDKEGEMDDLVSFMHRIRENNERNINRNYEE